MEKNFKSMSINEEPYKFTGIFTKSGSELVISFDSKSYANEIGSLLNKRVMIDNIAFFGEDETAIHYAGKFIIKSIRNKEALLMKF
ncbi:hypothetical protein FQ085_06640 [Planococcus sp. ANT_H30]|uniref:hypothetical protein n=1 Tax=Planococcus TaxID=1372 RepID=UPI0011EE206C|nr:MULTISPECIES: hypothetical protein [Planococcus]KAA0957724.1 hypothetical protein FQ085_06640 [Planococcus sp. ANT_H30]MCH4825755.1 hypothetical protein [Planococcus halocryophilus]